MNAIYCITNRVNGKMYIGKSVHVRIRITQHFRPQSHCFGLARAIKKHGKENFSWEVLADNVPDDMASETESFFIWQFRSIAPNGYNLTGGGEGFDKEGSRLRSQNPAWKKMMEDRNKALAKNPEWLARNKEQSTDPIWKANHAEGLKKRSNSQWRVNVALGAKKRKKDEVWKIKNLEAVRRNAKDPNWIKRNQEGANSRGKPVVCIDTEKVYFSIREAQRQTGILSTSILTVCKGKQKRKSAGGYRWRYATEEETQSVRRVTLRD